MKLIEKYMQSLTVFLCIVISAIASIYNFVSDPHILDLLYFFLGQLLHYLGISLMILFMIKEKISKNILNDIGFITGGIMVVVAVVFE